MCRLFLGRHRQQEIEKPVVDSIVRKILDLRWDEGTPTVRIVDSCPDTDRCDQQVRVRTIATGLQVPWDIAFLPDGGALVTERPGRVRLLTGQGRLQREPVARIAVTQAGEGGLLGIALDPDFADNHLVYLYFSRGRAMHLERWRWTGTRLVREVDLVRRIRAGDIHDSGRIRFGPDGLLYLVTHTDAGGLFRIEPA